jgi:hypothetical protein
MYSLSIEYVLYEMSYVNLQIYAAVLPGYDSKKEVKKKEEVINGDDPANRNRISDIINGRR